MTSFQVMQLVGEAFKEEENFSLDTQSRTIVLGITNWTTIRGKEFLLSKNVKNYYYKHNKHNRYT